MTRLLTATLIVTSLAFAPTLGFAQSEEEASEPSDDERFQAHLEEALAHYSARRYLEAVTEFEAAFEIRAEPELMYNIARSYERALRRQDAIDAYGRFIQLPGTTSEMRSRAISARRNLQAELDALAAPDEPDEEPPQESRSTNVSGDTTGGDGVVTPTEPVDEGNPTLRTAGWITLGVGVASAAAGAVFGGLALKANSDFDAATDRAEQIRLRDDVRRNALLTDVLVGAGAALAVTGVVLLLIGKPSSPDDDGEVAGVELMPVAGPDAVGLTLRGRL